MRKIIYISALVGLIVSYGFTAIQTADNCDKKALSEACKKKLEDYKYDSQKYSKINFTDRNVQMEVELPVFIGEKYRLIFNTSSLPKPILITVYSKSKESTKRVPLYTTKDAAAGTTEFVFDAPRVRNMYIDYDVPKEDKDKLSGCVIFMVGYK